MINYIKNLNEIKILIFDFDGTLYTLHSYSKQYYNYCLKAVKDMGGDIDKFSKLAPFEETYDKTKGGSLSDAIEKLGISRKKWNEYRNKNIFQVDFKDAEVIPSDVLKKLSEKYKLYLVSNKTKEPLRHFTDLLDIDLTPFSEVYSREDLPDKYGKEYSYKKIAVLNNVDYSNILVIGDIYYLDIEPILKLGGSGIMVESMNDYKEILKILI